MTATLAEVMDALADQIRDVVDNVTDVAVQVEPRIILTPTPPTIDMYPADPSGDPELRSFADMVGGELLIVRARVSTADHVAGQDLLLALMDDVDPLSLGAAIVEDKTLAGTAADVHLRERSGFITFLDTAGDAQTLGFTWAVVVIKARS